MKKEPWEETILTWKQTVECSHNPVLELRIRDICVAQAKPSFEAGARAAIDYFFYKAGLVRLMGCATMAECIDKLPNWQSFLKSLGIEK